MINLTEFKPQLVGEGDVELFLYHNDAVFVEPKIDGVRIICEKIGENAPLGMIFVSRKPIGHIAVIYSDSTDRPEDKITTRILRLEGCEKGLNQGDSIDSYQRQIYIHGTPEEGLIGQPASHGCIRMKNHDIMDLFSRIPVAMYVLIVE